jgi:acetyl-CoA carboxylase carboxyl transferase subunit alpha
MLEHSTFSVISPEGCSSILFRTADKRAEAATALKLTAQDLLELDVIDEIVREPLPAAHWDHEGAAERLKDALARNLDELGGVPPEELIAQRREKYRRIGFYSEQPA